MRKLPRTQGRRWLERLAEVGIRVTTAGWVKESENGRWRLSIATSLVRRGGDSREAYRRIGAVTREFPQPFWADGYVRLVEGSGQFAKAVQELHQHPIHPGGTALARRLERSAWMFGGGVLDAYFCDASTDIVAATIIAKSHHPALVLPEFFHDIRFPVRAILDPYANNINWRWRMAARKMMERASVLSLATIQALFNKFFRNGQRFFRDLLPAWIVHAGSRRHLFTITAICRCWAPLALLR